MTARKSLLALVMCLLLTAACSRADRACRPDAQGAPVDPALLAFLSRARAAHHLADSQEEHHPEQALKTLRAVLDGPLPGRSETRPAEVLEVLADTSARVADLQSQAQDFEGAVRTLNRALPWVPEPSYFRGHLYEVLGIVEERRARALTQAGSPQAAEDAKNRALAAFEQSMTIQAEVIRTSSIDAGKR
jgi:tetratricopeptide (TPR) repeat protein